MKLYFASEAAFQLGISRSDLYGLLRILNYPKIYQSFRLTDEDIENLQIMINKYAKRYQN